MLAHAGLCLTRRLGYSVVPANVTHDTQLYLLSACYNEPIRSAISGHRDIMHCELRLTNNLRIQGVVYISSAWQRQATINKLSFIAMLLYSLTALTCWNSTTFFPSPALVRRSGGSRLNRCISSYSIFTTQLFLLSVSTALSSSGLLKRLKSLLVFVLTAVLGQV